VPSHLRGLLKKRYSVSARCKDFPDGQRGRWSWRTYRVWTCGQSNASEMRERGACMVELWRLQITDGRGMGEQVTNLSSTPPADSAATAKAGLGRRERKEAGARGHVRNYLEPIWFKQRRCCRLRSRWGEAVAAETRGGFEAGLRLSTARVKTVIGGKQARPVPVTASRLIYRSPTDRFWARSVGNRKTFDNAVESRAKS